MKIKYIGQKNSIAVNLPVGSGKNTSIKILKIKNGDSVEIDDQDGEKLLELDSVNFEKSEGKRGRPKKEQDNEE